jgi:hypothetical protein
MAVPHRAQHFGGKSLAGLGIDYLKKASVQCNGYPISHALINGFNWPPLSIPAEEPVSISPEAVKRAGEGFWLSHATRPSSAFSGTAWHSGPSFQSRLVAVGQPARHAASIGESPGLNPRCARASGVSPLPCDATVGVGQPASCASCTRHAQPCFVPWIAFCPADRPDVSCACGVVQPASCAAVWQFIPPSRPSVPAPVLSVAFGVGQPLSPEPEPLPDVRCACARSAAIFRPDGVTRSFQVSAYKVEPSEPVLAGDLLAEDGDGLALLDVPVPERP